MRRLGKMLFGAITVAVIGGTGLCANSSICRAAGENLTVGEVYNTALEASYGDTFRGVYENYLAGSPLEAEKADGVDTATGHLMLSQNDLSLEGTGGMDFELNRYYDSNEANLGHATVEYLDEISLDTVWVHYKAEDGSDHKIVVNTALLEKHKNALKNLLVTYTKGEVRRDEEVSEDTQRTKIVSNEGHNVYGLASGWRYDFPWIETVTLKEEEGWGKEAKYLHYGSAGVMNIETEKDNDNSCYRIRGLKGYNYDDIKLEDWNKTVDGIACKYLLRDKTGLRTYFNENGVVVLQKDAHDNKITYTYTDEIYFSKITDSVGREIVFHYQENDGEKTLVSVTVQGKTVEGGVSRKTITYETEEKSYTPLHGDRLHGVILVGATVDGSKEKYSYKTVERLVNTSGAGVASQRVSTNQSYLLTKVTADGSEQHYEYRACSLRGEKKSGTDQKRDVVTEQFYVTREYEKDTKTGKKSNGIKYDYFQKQGNSLISFADFQESQDEVWQYGNSGLKTVTVVSTFNPNKYKTKHCTSWNFTKEDTEVIGEEDVAQTITTSYSKELNPSAYQSEVDTDNYYDQFNDDVLSESITKTVADAEGNILSETRTTIRGKNRSEVVSTYETDNFGRNVKENIVTKKQQDGKWLPIYETQTLFTYDDNGNISRTETKSRKEGEADWQTQIVKTDYDDQGNVTREYTPRGAKEGVSSNYTYDILGQMIKAEYPLEKEDGNIHYQTTITEYDTAGNVIAQNNKIDADRTARTEYSYDKRGSLVMVKNCMEDGKAQYVQYVYDIMGNKVRQFAGMTSPLTISVSEISDKNGEASGSGTEAGNAAKGSESGETREEADTFSYAGKIYRLTVNGKKKTDTIAETKYEYNEKNELVALIDPEGRKESYSYDENSNLTKTVDKNGNTLKNTYDYQNRLTEMVAKEKKTGKETAHTYTYNAYGDVETRDDTRFSYGDVSGQVTRETTKLTKNKDIVKSYAYDSADNKSAFDVTIGGENKLSLRYAYDGESKLASVTDDKGNQIVGYAYDDNGNLSERKVSGNNLTTTYTCDYQNRLTGMKNQTGSAGVVSEYSLEYLENGQKSKEVFSVLDKDGKKRSSTAAYTYDLLGRIRKETRTESEDITYSYDSNNNRKEMKVGNKITAYRYNKNDELLRTDTLNTNTEEDSVVIYKNDKNGNQLATVNRYEIPSDKKDSTYIDIDVTLGDNRLNENVVNHYNALNQLTQTLTKNYKVNYTYDAEGLRTSKTVNGEKTVFVWDGDQLVMELSDSGKVQKRYICGNDLVYADQGEGTEKQYYVKNPHGDVVQLTDESGKVIKTYEYDSFGNEVNPDRKDENPFRYCGEYYDKETDAIYLRARYYQPYLGRFLTRDTYTGDEEDSLSLHLYTYCGNDGVNRVDPSGNIWETIFDIVSLGDSIYSMCTNPSWENAGYLLWDAASLIPGVPGSYVAKVPAKTAKVAKTAAKVSKVGKGTRAASKSLRTASKAKRAKVLYKNKKYINKAKKLKVKKTKIKKVSIKINKKVARKTNKRSMYMGRTPGKSSRTGRLVIDRMKKEGKITTTKGKTCFKASDGKWYDLSKADMAHKVDAVSWWNSVGRKYGAKLKEVRKFMLNPDNYYLEHYSINRSQGPKLKQTYLPPTK